MTTKERKNKKDSGSAPRTRGGTSKVLPKKRVASPTPLKLRGTSKAPKKAVQAARPGATSPTSLKLRGVSESAPRLRIRVRAYENKVLDASVKQILDTALRFDAEVRGPIPLPTEIKKYTVNRSAFIFKDAREQFEMRVHKRVIDILNPSGKVVDALTNLSLPFGVSIDVKML